MSATKRPNSSHDGAASTARDTKRTRFQEPAQTDADRRRKANSQAAADEAAFDEQVLADLEGPSLANRKKAVKTDGYDSDSSDDGETVVRSRRTNANDPADDDDDMFAPSTSAAGGAGANDASSAKKQDTRFLNLGDIEGQEFTNDPNDDGGDSDEDDDQFEDDDARERKAKEGMGFELSSFNMKAEMEEGKFAEDGTFHRSFDPHAVHDRWLEDTDDREMRKARKTKKKMELREREAAQQEADAEKGKDELYKELVSFLAKGESVLEALQRLGKGSSGPGAKKKPRKGKGEAANAVPSISSTMDVDDTIAPISQSHAPAAVPTPIERVTSLASTLMSIGNLDIYEETYESLLRTVRRSGIVSPDWTPPPAVPADAMYEYHWAPAYVAVSGGQASATEVYGPYSKDDLSAWRDAAYFGESGERIELRIVGGKDWGGWDALL